MPRPELYRPLRDEFVSAASRGNLIPVYREILADGDTPVSAYAKLGKTPYSFLLESVVGGEKWAAYSFIGVEPRAILRCRGGSAHVEWRDVEGGSSREARWSAPDPAAALAEVMKEWRPVAVDGLPRFWGGAVGWISYDAVRAFESLPAIAERDLDIPELCVVLTDTVIVFDNLRQTIKVIATPYVPRPERAEAAYEGAIERIDRIIERLRAPGDALPVIEPPPPGEDGTARLRWGGGAEPKTSFSRGDFLGAVERCRDYILAGDIFQVVLSQRLEVPRGEVDPFDVYRALRVVNPSPYMYHLEFPEARVTGASPETLVRCDGGRIEVRPIAGTRPRGRDAAEDERLAADLQRDPKECAEHLMLIDLGRNDVGRVAQTGTVFVGECMTIERYSHVMHMVSHVHGDLAEGATWYEVLRAAFPAGTLSGAPKIRAMEIVEELEPQRRALYGGAVGYVSYSGNLDMAIAIRTLVTVGDSIYVQAGAGIVHDSNAELEYEETLNKARAVLRALAIAAEARAAKGGG